VDIPKIKAGKIKSNVNLFQPCSRKCTIYGVKKNVNTFYLRTSQMENTYRLRYMLIGNTETDLAKQDVKM
jgi:hypothetical protein